LDSPRGEELSFTFTSEVGGDKIADDLLRTNVFSYHHNRRTVGIQSRPMALYLQSKIGNPGSPERVQIESLLSKATGASRKEDI
jgi:hypothetical protein